MRPLSVFLVVAALSISAMALAAPGDPDATFGGGDGRVSYSSGPALDSIDGLAAQKDGKIIGVGYTEPVAGGTAMAVLRLEADGSPDSNFGLGGRLIDPVLARAVAAAVQDDGKIVLAGYGINGMAVARLTAKGAIDQSFGSGGAAAAGFGLNTYAAGVAILPDGRILAAGSGGAADLLLARFLSNGAPDPSFGVGGKVVVTANASAAKVSAMALLPGGKIALAGWAQVAPGADQVLTAVFAADGTPDSGFGADGVRMHALGGVDDVGIGLVAYPPDRILVGVSVKNASAQHHFGWLLLGLDGLVDASRIEGSGADGEPHAIAAQPDGKIVLAGRYGSSFGVRRYTTSLAPDASFGAAGLATVDLKAGVDTAYGALVQRDGKIVLGGNAGAAGPNSDIDFAFARIEAVDAPLLADDFADGVMDWNAVTGTWVELGGNLAATTVGAAAVYAPLPWSPSGDAGCSGACTVSASLALKSKGTTAKLTIVAWRTSTAHQVQLVYVPLSGKWILKQLVGTTVITRKVKAKISDGAPHDVTLSFDGFDFFAGVDGRPLLRMPGIEVPFGNVGFRVKAATLAVGDALVF
jgi:uncharacterized delta-60 repeat protein